MEITFIPKLSGRYPQLFGLEPEPKVLYIAANADGLETLESLPHQGVAFVGTRNPTLRSRIWTRQLIYGLRGTDTVIVSGLARGIDTEAHETAIAVGLRTVAVVGWGLEHPMPPTTQTLANKIIEAKGCIVSEFAPNSSPKGKNFLFRNRLISWWSKGTCIIEAPGRSGAMSTANWAIRQDRPVFAVPCFPGDPRMAGNQRLLDDDHAHALWGVHSLGVLRLEFSSKKNENPDQEGSEKKSDVEQILEWIRELLSEYGTISAPDLLEISQSHEWSITRLRSALENFRNSRQGVDDFYKLGVSLEKALTL